MEGRGKRKRGGKGEGGKRERRGVGRESGREKGEEKGKERGEGEERKERSRMGEWEGERGRKGMKKGGRESGRKKRGRESGREGGEGREFSFDLGDHNFVLVHCGIDQIIIVHTTVSSRNTKPLRETDVWAHVSNRLRGSFWLLGTFLLLRSQ